MKTIDIYTTPQCPFCKQLKNTLQQKSLAYTEHDVTAEAASLQEMQQLTNGAMSVPVMVLNKGQKDQIVTIGYDDALKALNRESPSAEKNVRAETATLTCPKCGHKQEAEMPTTACVPFYICNGCGQTIKAIGEECCVFCSYADKKCPIKSGKVSCEGGVCRLRH